MTGISGAAAARAADALIRTMGGTEVILLFPAAGMPADGVAGLGLGDPGVVQAEISPVIVREFTMESGGLRPRISDGPRRQIELLVGVSAMAEPGSQRNPGPGE